ncbi:MAG: hypothetical protein ACI9ES_003204 [Oceanospirillaceae bacterium]|jgi:hypothetical protein
MTGSAYKLTCKRQRYYRCFIDSSFTFKTAIFFNPIPLSLIKISMPLQLSLGFLDGKIINMENVFKSSYENQMFRGALLEATTPY